MRNSKHIVVTVSDGVTSVTLPGTKDVTNNTESVSEKKTMASGKVVLEAIGVRMQPSFKYSAISDADFAQLMKWAYKEEIISVTFPDPANGMVTMDAMMSIPTPGFFKFRADGTAVWEMGTVQFSCVEVV